MGKDLGMLWFDELFPILYHRVSYNENEAEHALAWQGQFQIFRQPHV
jgi:hypothetical protein